MLRAGLWTIALISGTLMLAQAVQGQTPSPSTLQARDVISMRPTNPDEIIVTAPPKASGSQVEHEAKVISRVDGSVLDTPLARFQTPVCPGIMGMPPEMAELMVDRIRYNAERIGVRVAKEDGCQPNIIVVFARNGQSEIRQLVSKHSYLFDQLTTAETKELIADPGPVHAWANTTVRSRFGDQISGESRPGRRNLVDVPTLYVSNSQSHIFLTYRQDIESSVVVIDIPAIDGLTINQIADYATMRSFARTRTPKDGAAAGTILSLFDKSSAPPWELTTFDLGYLKSLYGTPANGRAVTAIVSTRRAVRKAEQAAD